MVCFGWNRHNWRKLQALSWWDRWILLRAAVALPIVGVMLRSLGVRRTQGVLAWLSPLGDLVVSNDPTPDVAAAEHIARLVHIAARHGLYSANCLPRSLVLWYFLRRRGQYSEIRYGARSGENGFEAHAWVEYEGEVIGDNRDIGQVFALFKPSRA